MLQQRHFTIEEAEAVLPKVEILMKDVSVLRGKIESIIDSWQEKDSEEPAATALAQGRVDFIATQINRRLDSIQQLGCVPKDTELGLVDFPARLNGKEGFYCWKRGEGRIEYWHGLTEGYAGRIPIRQPA